MSVLTIDSIVNKAFCEESHLHHFHFQTNHPLAAIDLADIDIAVLLIDLAVLSIDLAVLCCIDLAMLCTQ
jgi:hypothetical protein